MSSAVASKREKGLTLTCLVSFFRDAAGINEELEKLEVAFQKILGVVPKFFRFPFGSSSALALQILAERGKSSCVETW